MTTIVFAMLAVLAGNAAAQQSAATLNGTVRDSSGAVIQQAQVTLTNLATSVKKDAMSNDSGVYSFLNVAPGDYNLNVSKTGFAPATQKGMHIVVNQALTQDFMLKAGTATMEEVVVQASAVELNTANSSLGEVIETRPVRDLPLNGRNFTQLLTLIPAGGNRICLHGLGTDCATTPASPGCNERAYAG